MGDVPNGDADGVSVVQDTSEYLDEIQSSKERAARWVRGLAPEDEENEYATMRAREEFAAAEAEHAAMAADAAAEKLARGWLHQPLFLGLFYLGALLLTYRSATGFEEMMLLDFPETEERAWTNTRRPGENVLNFALRVVLPLLLPSGVAAACAGWLCFLIGTAAHHFTALCGVGTAMLSALALIGQAMILWLSCGISSISDRWECDVPFVLYWVCSAVRVGGPMLSLWCAAPVMDIARRSHYLKYLVALPVAIFTVAMAVTVRDEERATRLFQLAYEAVLVIWSFFFLLCWRQPSFTVVIRTLKAHVD